MKPKRFWHSIRFRITAGVLLVLTIILSALAYARHTRYARLLTENLHISVENAGEIIEGSLQHSMLNNDFSTLAQVVHDIGEQPGVLDVFLLDKSGSVIISTENQTVGHTIDIEDKTCQACHQYTAASRNENVVLSLDGRPVFRNVNAIENAEQCVQCHDPDSPVLGVLISDFDMAPIEVALAADRRNSLLWSSLSIALILITVDLLMNGIVIGRLERLARTIRRVGQGDLEARAPTKSRDEIGVLGRALNQMTDGLDEKARLEQSLKEQTTQLQVQAKRLSTLNTVADTVSQSLDLKHTLDSALDTVLTLMNLRASWIVLQDEQTDAFELVAVRGLPESVAHSHVQCVWDRCICAQVLEAGKPQVSEDVTEHDCPTADYFQREGLVFRACIPLRSRDRVLGVMSLVGDAVDGGPGLADDAIETLTAIGRQIGIAVENASLYGELQQQETLRRHLLERVIAVQEEERKRIALELHDQTGQSLTSLIMTLGVVAEAQSMDEVKAHTQELRALASQVLQEVHDLALELRPSVLDDLGLLAALRHLHREYQDRFRLPIDFQALGLNGERLPTEVETTLYRIVQEALTNIARHAQASSISVLLEKRGTMVKLIVEDDGQGFDVNETMSEHSRDRLGLYGMRERASLLDGTLTIESSPGTGTAIFVEIPLNAQGGSDG